MTGYNFTPASTIDWDGLPQVAIFQNPNILTAQVPATLIQNPGTATITVTTPSPGGGTTLPLTFTISATQSPIPHITSTSPSSILAGSAAVTLNVTGSNFTAQSAVVVGNTPLQTTYENPAFLQATIQANEVANAGTLQITVVNPGNPSPGGGVSNAYAFNVNNPVPTITALNPATIAVGTTTNSFSVTGVGFANSAVILINGVAHVTTASSTSATTVLNAVDLNTGGVALVQVVNPAPGGGASNSLTFAVDPTYTLGLPILVDYGFDGNQANNGICGGQLSCQNSSPGTPGLNTSGPSSSQTGEFVAFASTSSNVLLNQTSVASQIYLRDTCLAQTCAPTTFLVSLGSNNAPANGASSEPSIDATAAHATYTSTASNLVNYVPTTGTTRQVYWQPICSPTTATGTSTSNSTITACTTATTTTGGSIPSNAAVLVSMGADGSAGNGDSYNPVISPDGQFVAFVSLATNLVSGVTVDGVTPQVYLRTMCSGVTPLTQTTTTGTTTTTTSTCIPTTYLVSSPEGITPGNAASSSPAIGNTGTYVSFVSSASNLSVPNPNKGQEVFEQKECQLATLGCVPTMTIISTPDGTAPAGGVNSEPAISYDGRFVAFASTAVNLGVASSGLQQIYVRDTCTGATTTNCTPATRLVSTPNGTTPANGLSEFPSINENSTGSGQLIAFASLASNLSLNTANGIENVYVRNTCDTIATSAAACAPGTVLVSEAEGTSPPTANGNSYRPSISADGHTVSFLSFANDIVAHDTNGFEDIFLAASTF